MQVLSCTGVQCEAHLPFAGLHQLVRPILDGADGLPAPQRAALLAAFGMAEVAAPEFFLIALAVLDLLADAAARVPLLVAEDVQWLDHSTCDVLAFVARRLGSEPIVLLLAVRDGYEGPLNEEAGLPDLRLEGLDDASAGALLDAHAPELARAVRERLLEEAAGNPLALVELPAALGSEELAGDTMLPVWLPLSSLRSSWPVLRNPANRKRTVALSPRQFRYGFTNTLSQQDSDRAHDRYHVPTSGRPLWQAATANLTANPATKVNLRNNDRAPLLLIAGGSDHGWEEVADYALKWATEHAVIEAPDSPAMDHATVHDIRQQPGG